MQKQKDIDDPDQARYIRKKYNQEGYDQQQQDQQQQFSKNLDKALRNHSKQVTQKKLEDQINYFGNVIEPFNMRRQQQFGQIDQEGYFVFNKRSRLRDPWLESIEEAEDQEIAQKIRKKINTGGRFQNVYQGDTTKNKNYIEEEPSQEEDEQNQKPQQEDKQEQEKEDIFTPKEIKQLLASMLPDNSNANKYLKTLKKQKNNQMYDKILLLCNQYIEQTQDHQILTTKKQNLIQQSQESVVDWDEDNQKHKSDNRKQQQDQDNIF